ncbi:MAG: hypothetical protein ACI9GM_001579 [Salibacteraceae bacterium]|jgi:hypothetical protein
MGLIEQEKVSERIYLFPNPTVNQMNTDNANKYINGEFTIYSQTGAVKKFGRFSSSFMTVWEWIFFDLKT